jgi:hypothetical protein
MREAVTSTSRARSPARGPFELVYVPGLVSNVELAWEPARIDRARFFRRLASFSRLILFDNRGTGLSDRVAGIATLETRMDDVRAGSASRSKDADGGLSEAPAPRGGRGRPREVRRYQCPNEKGPLDWRALECDSTLAVAG